MIRHIDHVVLTTRHRDRCIDFYTRVLGMTLETFGQGRLAFRFGDQKINLHEAGREFEPKAAQRDARRPRRLLHREHPAGRGHPAARAAGGVAIELGPVPKTGATGPIRSVYVRDPDGNLIEIAEPADGAGRS